MADNLFCISNAQFGRPKLLLPDKVRGVSRVDDRRAISEIVHVLKSGRRWVDVPRKYGPRKTLYSHFVRWVQKGVWRDVFVALADAGGPPSQALIESSSVRARRIRMQEKKRQLASPLP
jgi:transposase